ncbi:MAG TPA: 2-oxoacid:ferredoxin oxidoreductase subunit beta, partial [Actinomycetota bacterium]
DKQQGVHNQIRLVDGEPIVFDEGTRCVRVGENGRLEIAAVADSDPSSIVTHEVHGRPSLAFALAHLSQGPTEPTCIGVFHEEDRSTYGEAVRSQLERAVERLGPGDLKTLLHGGDTWTVG